MARPKKNKSLPEYMVERKGYFETRRPIHDDHRHHFPELTGKRAVKVLPVGKVGSSGRPSGADREQHNKNLDLIEGRIKAGNDVVISPSPFSVPRALYTPDQIIDALTQWGERVFRQQYLAYCNGIKPLIGPVSNERLEWSRQIAKLRQDLRVYRDSAFVDLPMGEQEAISDQMLKALSTRGVSLPKKSPMAGHQGIMATYLTVRLSLEERLLQVAIGDFSVKPDEEFIDVDEKANSLSSPVQNQSTGELWRLSDLINHYLKIEKFRNNLDKKKRFWSFLIKNVGDIFVRDVNSIQMGKLNNQLRRTPIIKIGEYSEYSLQEISDNLSQIKENYSEFSFRSKKTIYDYFCAYKNIFEYAVEMKVIRDNPITRSMMDKPTKEETTGKVKSYSKEDIEYIFSTPIYTGCDKVRANPKNSEKTGKLYGYRNRKGQLIERDGRYFMPLLALLTGARMEEWGGAKTRDVKCQDNIWFLDLTHRSVKTHTSKRVVPLHPLLVAKDKIDFITYVIEQKQKGEEFLFPEFTPAQSEASLESDLSELSSQLSEGDFNVDESDPVVIKRTAVYSRWFGHWRRANGLSSKYKNFHSFRHTFKDAIRFTPVKEEVHDIITGHYNPNNGRAYGGNIEAYLIRLPEFYSAVSQVSYSNLPWK